MTVPLSEKVIDCESSPTIGVIQSQDSSGKATPRRLGERSRRADEARDSFEKLHRAIASDSVLSDPRGMQRWRAIEISVGELQGEVVHERTHLP